MSHYKCKGCSHLTPAFASLAKHNIVSIVMQMLMQSMGSDPFSEFAFCVTIDAMLNFYGTIDIDVDVKADNKCEQSISYH